MARCTSTAVTVESTPPLNPHTTRPVAPTVERIRSVASATNDAIVQSARASADLVRKGSQDLGAAFGVCDFGMKQEGVQATR